MKQHPSSNKKERQLVAYWLAGTVGENIRVTIRLVVLPQHECVRHMDRQTDRQICIAVSGFTLASHGRARIKLLRFDK